MTMPTEVLPGEAAVPVDQVLQETTPQVPVEIRPGVVEDATFEALMAKGKRRDEIPITDPTGKTMLVRAEAVSNLEYDTLIGDCPPKQKDTEVGRFYELEKFGPRLLAACLTTPQLSISQAEQLWRNPNWAPGEIVGLFVKVNGLCNRGLDVPFTGLG